MDGVPGYFEGVAEVEVSVSATRGWRVVWRMTRVWSTMHRGNTSSQVVGEGRSYEDARANAALAYGAAIAHSQLPLGLQ